MTEVAPRTAAPAAPAPAAEPHAVDKGVMAESPTSVIGHNATVKSPPSPGRAAPGAPAAAAPRGVPGQYHHETGAPPAGVPGHYPHETGAAVPPQYHHETGAPPGAAVPPQYHHETATPGPVDGKNTLGSSLKSDHTHGSMDRDAALAKVHGDKTVTQIKAWEESQIAKSVNRCNAKIAKIGAWENTKKAAAEAKLKQAEERLEKKRAKLVEKMRNQIAAAHKMAEEKRAEAEARKGEEIFKIQEDAAKYKAQGHKPGGFLCFKS